MPDLLSIFRVNDFFAQLQPSAELLRRAIGWPRPAPAGEATAYFCKRAALAKMEKSYARAF